jgi:hypothetical protein
VTAASQWSRARTDKKPLGHDAARLEHAPFLSFGIVRYVDSGASHPALELDKKLSQVAVGPGGRGQVLTFDLSR